MAKKSRPELHNTRKNKLSLHLVSLIDVKNFGAETVRVGDLNGDGAPDLLFIQNLYGTRAITCLTATTIAGDILWQIGKPSRKNGFIYCDLPVQVYDWDNDGHNEVLYVEQAEYAELYPGTSYAVERAKRYNGHAALIVLDARNGKRKGRIPLPAPADDCFLLADLTGRGRREDLVVKDRYWNMWGIAHNGRALWRWEGSVGHFPAVGDVDGDGRDEVFVGYALIDHNGKVLFEKDSQGHHQDACCMVQLADGTWRLLFGNHGIHCLNARGKELWYHPLQEAQHVVPGRFRLDSEMQFMVIDRGDRVKRLPATLYLYDLKGRELWRREQPKGSWCSACVKASWLGPGAPDAALVYARSPVIRLPRGKELLYMRQPGTPEVIYDGDGKVVNSMTLQYVRKPSAGELNCMFYGLAADVWGDSRDEIILFGTRGACIYANARPLAVPTLYNETFYTGV